MVNKIPILIYILTLVIIHTEEIQKQPVVLSPEDDDVATHLTTVIIYYSLSTILIILSLIFINSKI